MEQTEERTLTNIVLEVRENFKKKNGRLVQIFPPCQKKKKIAKKLHKYFDQNQNDG